MRNIVQLRKRQGNYWALCRETIQKNLKLCPRGTKGKKKKILLRSCLPLVSSPFLPDTRPAPARDPCQRYGCGTAEKMAKAGWIQLFYPLPLGTTPCGVCCRERGKKIKTCLKEDQYIWQPGHSWQTHVFSNVPLVQKIRPDFLLGILHWNGPTPSKGDSNF